jgi:hypothetical protein
MDGSASTITNVLFAGNASTLHGGGILLWDGATPAITNSVFVGNDAAGQGGGLWVGNYAAPDLISVIVADNTATNGGGIYQGTASATLMYCDAWGNSPDDYDGLTDPTGTDGNQSVDPEFLDVTDPDALYWNVHLSSTSTLIDAGDPAVLDSDGSPSDIGLYGGPGAESFDLDWDGQFEWWLPGDYDSATSAGMDCNDLDLGVFYGTGC